MTRQLTESYHEQKNNLYMEFIDLDKTYDKVLRKVMRWTFDKNKFSTKYITLVKDMYDDF